MNDNTAPIGHNQPKNKGAIRVTISVMSPNPEKPELGAQMDCAPIFYDIPEVLPAQVKELPAGLLAEVRKVMEAMCELVRNHVHLSLADMEQLHKENLEIHQKQKEQQKLVLDANIQAALKDKNDQIIGGPRVDVFVPGMDGAPTFLDSRPAIVTENGLELADDK